MRLPSWITGVWPGLPRLWAHGDWGALLWATTFAVVLNFALVVTFVWPELISSSARSALWLSLAAVWLVSTAWYAWRSRLEATSPEQVADLETLFVRAQEACLRGDWHEAEADLRKLLRADPRDADSLLMLATLMRHTDRIDESRRQLNRLEQLESSEKWRIEIQREYERLDKLDAAHLDDASESDQPDEEDGEVDVVSPDVPGSSAGASEAA